MLPLEVVALVLCVLFQPESVYYRASEVVIEPSPADPTDPNVGKAESEKHVLALSSALEVQPGIQSAYLQGLAPYRTIAGPRKSVLTALLRPWL
jgi:hypothetical protein